MRILSKAGTVLLKGAVELLLFLPVLLVVAVYLLPESVRWLWLGTLPLLYVAGFTIGTFVPIPWLFLLLLIVASIGGGYSYLLFDSVSAMLISALFACSAVYRGFKLVFVSWYLLFPAGFYLFGMILYFIGSVILHFVDEFQPYLPLLTWGGVVALAVTLLVTNESNMKQETLPGDKEPVIASDMKWKNRLLIGSMMLIIIFIVGFQMLQRAVNWVKEQLVALLRALFAPSDKPPAAADGQKAPDKLPDFANGEPPPEWMVLLEKLIYYAAAAIVIALLLLLLYTIARKIPRWVRLAISWLAARLHTPDMKSSRIGYEDDVESLMDWEQLNDRLLAGWKRLFRGSVPQEKWDQMTTNRDRVRFLYRSLLRRSVRYGYLLKPHLTPQETNRELKQWGKQQGSDAAAADTLVSVYDKVRYGDKDVSDIEVLELKDQLEKLK